MFRALTIFVTLCVVLLVAAQISGCGGKGGRGFLTSELIFVDQDTDEDGLSDGLERELGTNPLDRDTDHDGLIDYYELVYMPAALGLTAAPVQLDPGNLLDFDSDGLHAALDKDDDGDGVNDALQDADGDGIPNVYEHYGFTVDLDDRTQLDLWGCTYDADADEFIPKDQSELDYSVKYFKTDPTQPSTDADPYGDMLEATGIGLDQGVVAPANNPSVPASPNFYAVMDSYVVTVLAEITSTTGGSISSGSSWTNTISDSKQTGTCRGMKTANNLITGALGKVGLGFLGGVATGAVSNLIDPAVSKHTVTESHSGFSNSWENWGTATQIDTGAAAKIKLNLKVYNFGTAPAADVLPGLALAIGNQQIATVKPATGIESLAVNSQYPQGLGTYWTVAKDEDGNDITLSLDELKSIETGAPITMGLADVSATVQKPVYDPVTQMLTFEDVGSWADYVGRIQGLSCVLVVDMGEGNFANYFSFAPPNPKSGSGSAPPVYLIDALLWTIGDYDENDIVQGLKITFPGGTNPQFLEDKFDDWTFIFDSHYTADELNQAHNALTVKLKPNSVIYLKAPPPDDQKTPPIQWATMSSIPVTGVKASYDAISDQYTKEIAASVTDYFEVKDVYMRPSINAPESDWIKLQDDDGDSVYTSTFPAEFLPTGSEVVVASNIDSLTSQREVSFAGPVGTTHQLHGSRAHENSSFDLDNNTQGNTYGGASFPGWDVEVYLINYEPESYWKAWCFTGVPAALFEFGPTASYADLSYADLKNRHTELSSQTYDQWPYWHYNSTDVTLYWMLQDPFSFEHGTTFGLITDQGNLAKLRVDNWTDTYDSSWGWRCDEVYVTYIVYRDIN